ncbi:hypothetical protein UC8_32740 [Roseimaritima ulvae]|uniref:Uncharacterized protein n=1 Tax=Roseimaritima ulvae TaxID=980254 RepID=A0A5B9QV62_9BACT|nr:hypothetical protein UC8_32740 [Roseimaritima ulvae]
MAASVAKAASSADPEDRETIFQELVTLFDKYAQAKLEGGSRDVPRSIWLPAPNS